MSTPILVLTVAGVALGAVFAYAIIAGFVNAAWDWFDSDDIAGWFWPVSLPVLIVAVLGKYCLLPVGRLGARAHRLPGFLVGCARARLTKNRLPKARVIK